MIVTLALLMFALPVQAEFLTNGDFEQPLSVGWTQGINNAAGEYSFDRWDTMGQPTPGFAARVYKYLMFYATLSQTADVPGAALEFRFDGRLRMAGGSSACWPAGAVVLSYLSSSGAELGSTMFLLRNEYCDWVESDTLHFIDVTLPDEWVSYQLDIARELADNLPGVNPADVRKMKVQLYSYVNGT